MVQTTINNLKPGSIFQFKQDGRDFELNGYCREGFPRGKGRYSYNPCDDICDEHFATPTRKVWAYEENLKKK